MNKLTKTLTLLALITAVPLFFYWSAEVATAVKLPLQNEAPFLWSNQDRDDLTKTYLKAIKEAKSSILLFIYTLNDPSVIYALKEKAEKGDVKVQVVCDTKASPYAKKQLGAAVEMLPYKGQGLMHLKILTVDDSLVILGSANLARHSLRMHGNLVLGFVNKEAAQFIRNRITCAAGHKTKKEDVHDLFSIGGQKIELWFLPNPTKAVERIIHLIDSAKKTMRIAMFTWTRRDFAEAALRAKLRGVAVEVAMDSNSSKGTNRKIAQLLKKEKVPLRVNTDIGLLHHKFMIIDEETLVVGSANWTDGAFKKNQDCFMVLHSLTEPQRKKIKGVWKTILSDSQNYHGKR